MDEGADVERGRRLVVLERKALLLLGGCYLCLRCYRGVNRWKVGGVLSEGLCDLTRQVQVTAPQRLGEGFGNGRDFEELLADARQQLLPGARLRRRRLPRQRVRVRQAVLRGGEEGGTLLQLLLDLRLVRRDLLRAQRVELVVQCLLHCRPLLLVRACCCGCRGQLPLELVDALMHRAPAQHVVQTLRADGMVLRAVLLLL
mmetsp:Transcript_11873/g.27970  ORF Transcript_11873/g.27970 Transcript_11873/m.27970 type:complete len:201 (-) Transcript_11873:389-991(-)